MKLTSRERLLIGILICVTLLYGYYRLILMGQWDKINQMQEQQRIYEGDVEKLQSRAASEPQLENRIQELAKRFEELNLIYFSSLEQEDLILLINGFLEEAGFTNSSLYFTPPYQEPAGELVLHTMELTLNYSGSYQSLTRLIALISNYEKKIAIDHLQIQSQGREGISGSLTLRFYALSPNDNPGDSMFSWEEGIGDFYDPFLGFIETPSSEPADQTMPELRYEIGDSRVLLEGFEASLEGALSVRGGARGNMGKSTLGRDSTGALQLEYDIPKTAVSSQVGYSLNQSRHRVLEAPKSISLWVYAYYSGDISLSLGLKTNTQESNILQLTNTVQWRGWKQLTANMPQDPSLYPLIIEGIYLEGVNGISEKGMLVFDDLEINYPAEPWQELTQNSLNHFSYYEVRPGDTLMGISRRFFNHPYGVEALRRANGLTEDDVLSIGQQLLIPLE